MTVRSRDEKVAAVTGTHGGPGDGRYWPEKKGSDDELRSICYERAHEIYGEELPEPVQSRLDLELDAITDNGYTVIYYTAMELARSARELGSPVSFRGAAGSSLAAFMAGITDINPLPPHYSCLSCHHYEEAECSEQTETCWELMPKRCPVCGSRMKKDGYRIPAEGLFGLHMDRQPYIDLSVANGFRDRLEIRLKEIFEDCNIYLAHPYESDTDEIDATASYIILPKKYCIQDFSPLEEHSNSSNFEETAFSIFEFAGQFFTLDITEQSSLQLLEKFTAVTDEKLTGIPLDASLIRELYLSDSPFTNAIFRRLSDITGIQWKEETAEVRKMLKKLNARSVCDYIRVAALVEGTGTWNSFVKELIESNVCTLRDIITTREDIINYLTARGMDGENAFSIMRRVSLGLPLHTEQCELMKRYNVPDWYIKSCGFINYLMPRAWACARAINTTRIAWFLVAHLSLFKEVWQEYMR